MYVVELSLFVLFCLLLRCTSSRRPTLRIVPSTKYLLCRNRVKTLTCHTEPVPSCTHASLSVSQRVARQGVVKITKSRTSIC